MTWVIRLPGWGYVGLTEIARSPREALHFRTQLFATNWIRDHFNEDGNLFWDETNPQGGLIFIPETGDPAVERYDSIPPHRPLVPNVGLRILVDKRDQNRLSGGRPSISQLQRENVVTRSVVFCLALTALEGNQGSVGTKAVGGCDAESRDYNLSNWTKVAKTTSGPPGSEGPFAPFIVHPGGNRLCGVCVTN